MPIKIVNLITIVRAALACIVYALLATTAHAQVGPQSMKYLANMQGFVALQRLMVLPAPAGAPPANAASFKRSAGVYSQAMNEAAQQMAKGGASVGMVSRMTGSGYFSNAARKYGASIGIARADSDVAHAVASFMAVCRQAEKNEETNATQAAQMLATVQQKLSAQPALADAGDAGRQAMADAVNVQTGLAFWNIQGRKKTASNNNELAYYCGQNLKKIGIALDKL
jgi:hypothetical protein